jgi:hypothetical protein
MTRLLQWFRDRKARRAARFLQQCRVRREEKYKAVHRQLRAEAKLPPRSAWQ